MAWIRKKIKVRKEFDKLQRQAIAQDIIDTIVERTTVKNIDRKGNPFPGYSKAYTQSLDFKIAGKTKGNVNLRLSGDMLNSLKVLNTKKGEITIGFDRGDSENNGKAEGNIKGTYGQKTSTGKKRDFLGLPRNQIKEIQDSYVPTRENRERILERIAAINQLLNE